MNQNLVKVIGIKDKSRKDAELLFLNHIEGLKDILNSDFIQWSNFDGWESMSVQQWVFSRALEVYRGKKIDIKCYCCEFVGSPQSYSENIKKEKCYGKKIAYMIEKVLDEIVIAKSKRESDGTYSA